MIDVRVIEAAKSGDLQVLRNLGARVDEPDEVGWSALNWAAGAGCMEAVKLLLEMGADATLTGRDQRTPQMIARAANHRAVAEVLAEAEARRLASSAIGGTSKLYCRAFTLAQVARFPAWSSSDADPPAVSDEDIVYLHQDFTVTRSMWHDEAVLWRDVTPEWQAFCESELGFSEADSHRGSPPTGA